MLLFEPKQRYFFFSLTTILTFAVANPSNFAIFSAKCSSTQTYAQGQIITFNRTSIYFGGEYDFDVSTGEYTCPFPGTYEHTF